VKIHLQRIRNSGYDRMSPKWKAKTLLAYYQPLPAYLGLICCLLVALGFTSSLWWHSDVTFAKFAAAYTSVGDPKVFKLSHDLPVLLKIAYCNVCDLGLSQALPVLEDSAQDISRPLLRRA
jgi:hypothetical protein